MTQNRTYKKVIDVPSYELPPQSWKPITLPDGSTGAMVACHECGMAAGLDDHRVHKSGHVWPSLVCPSDSCSAHTWAFLEGWNTE